MVYFCQKFVCRLLPEAREAPIYGSVSQASPSPSRSKPWGSPEPWDLKNTCASACVEKSEQSLSASPVERFVRVVE